MMQIDEPRPPNDRPAYSEYNESLVREIDEIAAYAMTIKHDNGKC